MKNNKMQARRPMPKMRNKIKTTTTPKTQTIGDLIAAAYDALGDSHQVERVLSSHRLGERIGMQIVFI